MNNTYKKMLQERIEIAFLDIPSPQSNNIVEQQSWAELDLERSSVVNIFQGKDWKDISIEDIIETANTALHLFTNESFIYFLPAYMNAALVEYEKFNDSIAIDVFINRLIPPKNLLFDKKTSNNDSMRRKRFEALRKLTDDQKKCVKLFLEFMDKEHSDDFFDKDYSFGEIEDSGYILPSPALALELYWGQI